MNILQKIAIYTVITLVGVPTMALGSSFTVSLIQGKTPAEAVQVIAEQLDFLTGRVDQLESSQAKTQAEVDQLKEENAALKNQIDVAKSATDEYTAEKSKKAQCAELSSQITAKEQAIKKSYEDRIAPLRAEIKSLSVQLTTQSTSQQVERQATGDSSDFDDINARIEASKKTRAELQTKKNQLNAITAEMEKAIENSQELQNLIKQANSMLCA